MIGIALDYSYSVDLSIFFAFVYFKTHAFKVDFYFLTFIFIGLCRYAFSVWSFAHLTLLVSSVTVYLNFVYTLRTVKRFEPQKANDQPLVLVNMID